MHYGYVFSAILVTMVCIGGAALLAVGAAVIDNVKDLIGEIIAMVVLAALVTLAVFCWAHV